MNNIITNGRDNDRIQSLKPALLLHEDVPPEIYDKAQSELSLSGADADSTGGLGCFRKSFFKPGRRRIFDAVFSAKLSHRKCGTSFFQPTLRQIRRLQRR